MPEPLLLRIRELFPDVDVVQGYGMTEASALLTVLTAEDHRRGGDVLRSAGRPVPGVRLSILDPDGNRLPPGEIGEVCAQGGNFMTEYWKKPEATAEAFHGGWYHSGDAGYIDEDGYLFLVDRVKDMIVTGGENVYSTEVENAIASHPAVLQVAVIGIPSEQWGEAVHAIVVLKEGQTATDQELIDHAREWIAGYKVPKSVEFRDRATPAVGRDEGPQTRTTRSLLGGKRPRRGLVPKPESLRRRGSLGMILRSRLRSLPPGRPANLSSSACRHRVALRRRPHHPGDLRISRCLPPTSSTCSTLMKDIRRTLG